MKKQAFSMITAIIFILLVAVISVGTLNTSSTTVSFTARSYVKEQAYMLLDLGRSYALKQMYISGDPMKANPQTGTIPYDGGGVYDKTNNVRELYYPLHNDDKNYEYKITVTFKPDKVNTANMHIADKNTLPITVVVETKGGVLEDTADIRIARDYVLSN